MDKRNFYTEHDSGKVFLWAILLPQIISLIFACIFASVYKTQEEMQSSIFYILVACVLAQACFAFILYYYNKKNKICIKQATKLNININLKNVLVCMLISIIAVFGFVNLVSAANNFFAWIGFNLGGVEVPNHNFWWFLFNVVFLVALPAIFEEFIFRGIIFNGLRGKGFWFACIISAVMFAVMHLSIEQFVFPIIMGVVFALILEKTGSIVYTIITHFCNNFIVVLISYISNFTGRDIASFNTNSVTGALIALLIAAIAGTVIWLLIKYLLKPNMQTNEQKIVLQSTNLTQQNTNFIHKNFVLISLISGIVLWLVVVVGSLLI